jgi:hypothetical protein
MRAPGRQAGTRGSATTPSSMPTHATPPRARPPRPAPRRTAPPTLDRLTFSTPGTPTFQMPAAWLTMLLLLCTRNTSPSVQSLTE